MLGPLNSLSEAQTFQIIWYMKKPCIYLIYCWTLVKSTASVVFRPNSWPLQMEKPIIVWKLSLPAVQDSTLANIFISSGELIEESPWDSKISLKHKYFHDYGPGYKYHWLGKSYFPVERKHAKIFCITFFLVMCLKGTLYSIELYCVGHMTEGNWKVLGGVC